MKDIFIRYLPLHWYLQWTCSWGSRWLGWGRVKVRSGCRLQSAVIKRVIRAVRKEPVCNNWGQERDFGSCPHWSLSLMSEWQTVTHSQIEKATQSGTIEAKKDERYILAAPALITVTRRKQSVIQSTYSEQHILSLTSQGRILTHSVQQLTPRVEILLPWPLSLNCYSAQEKGFFSFSVPFVLKYSKKQDFGEIWAVSIFPAWGLSSVYCFPKIVSNPRRASGSPKAAGLWEIRISH